MREGFAGYTHMLRYVSFVIRGYNTFYALVTTRLHTMLNTMVYTMLYNTNPELYTQYYTKDYVPYYSPYYTKWPITLDTDSLANELPTALPTTLSTTFSTTLCTTLPTVLATGMLVVHTPTATVIIAKVDEHTSEELLMVACDERELLDGVAIFTTYNDAARINWEI